MQIDIWSDVVCPWCYIGKRRLEQALTRFEHGSEITVVWHSFQLDPTAPARTDRPNVERLAAKYGLTRDEAQHAQDRVTTAAAAEGLDFDLDGAQHGNSFDAHRLIHLGADRGVQGQVNERMLRGYFIDARSIGDPEMLVALAVDGGLDEAEARHVLATDQYADAVRADVTLARDLGITAVPFFVIDGRYGVSGAQPSPIFAEALARAWAESHAFATPVGAGDVNESDTCDGGSGGNMGVSPG